MYRLPRRCALRGVYIPIANLVTTITARIRQVTKLTVRLQGLEGTMWKIREYGQEIFALTLAAGTLLALASVFPA